MYQPPPFGYSQEPPTFNGEIVPMHHAAHWSRDGTRASTLSPASSMSHVHHSQSLSSSGAWSDDSWSKRSTASHSQQLVDRRAEEGADDGRTTTQTPPPARVIFRPQVHASPSSHQLQHSSPYTHRLNSDAGVDPRSLNSNSDLMSARRSARPVSLASTTNYTPAWQRANQTQAASHARTHTMPNASPRANTHEFDSPRADVRTQSPTSMIASRSSTPTSAPHGSPCSARHDSPHGGSSAPSYLSFPTPSAAIQSPLVGRPSSATISRAASPPSTNPRFAFTQQNDPMPRHVVSPSASRSHTPYALSHQQHGHPTEQIHVQTFRPSHNGHSPSSPAAAVSSASFLSQFFPPPASSPVSMQIAAPITAAAIAEFAYHAAEAPRNSADGSVRIHGYSDRGPRPRVHPASQHRSSRGDLSSSGGSLDDVPYSQRTPIEDALSPTTVFLAQPFDATIRPANEWNYRGDTRVTNGASAPPDPGRAHWRESPPPVADMSSAPQTPSRGFSSAAPLSPFAAPSSPAASTVTSLFLAQLESKLRLATPLSPRTPTTSSSRTPARTAMLHKLQRLKYDVDQVRDGLDSIQRSPFDGATDAPLTDDTVALVRSLHESVQRSSLELIRELDDPLTGAPPSDDANQVRAAARRLHRVISSPPAGADTHIAAPSTEESVAALQRLLLMLQSPIRAALLEDSPIVIHRAPSPQLESVAKNAPAPSPPVSVASPVTSASPTPMVSPRGKESNDEQPAAVSTSFAGVVQTAPAVAAESASPLAQAVARWSFTAQVPGQLTVRTGDELTVHSAASLGWVDVSTVAGDRGQVPANVCQYLQSASVQYTAAVAPPLPPVTSPAQVEAPIEQVKQEAPVLPTTPKEPSPSPAPFMSLWPSTPLQEVPAVATSATPTADPETVPLVEKPTPVANEAPQVEAASSPSPALLVLPSDVPLPSSPAISSSSSASSPPPAVTAPSTPIAIDAISMRAFSASKPGQLSFDVGAVMTVLEPAVDGWVRVQNESGGRGLIPEDHCKYRVRPPQQVNERTAAVVEAPTQIHQPEEKAKPNESVAQVTPSPEASVASPVAQSASTQPADPSPASDGSQTTSSTPAAASPPVAQTPSPASVAAPASLTAVALFPFTATLPTQLSFAAGESLTVHPPRIGGWITIENAAGQRGHGPENYLDIKEKKEEKADASDAAKHAGAKENSSKANSSSSPAPVSSSSAAAAASSASSSSSSSSAPASVTVAVAQHDFDAPAKGQLPFRRGDVMTVLAPAALGWIQARHDNGKKGYIPANYVELQTKKKEEPPADAPVPVVVEAPSYPTALSPSSPLFDATNMAFASSVLPDGKQRDLAEQHELALVAPKNDETSLPSHLVPVVRSIILQRHPQQYPSFALFPFLHSRYDLSRDLTDGLRDTRDFITRMEAAGYDAEIDTMQSFRDTIDARGWQPIYSAIESQVAEFAQQYARHHTSAIDKASADAKEEDVFGLAAAARERASYERDRAALEERDRKFQKIPPPSASDTTVAAASSSSSSSPPPSSSADAVQTLHPPTPSTQEDESSAVMHSDADPTSISRRYDSALVDDASTVPTTPQRLSSPAVVASPRQIASRSGSTPLGFSYLAGLSSFSASRENLRADVSDDDEKHVDVTPKKSGELVHASLDRPRSPHARAHKRESSRSTSATPSSARVPPTLPPRSPILRSGSAVTAATPLSPRKTVSWATPDGPSALAVPDETPMASSIAELTGSTTAMTAFKS